MGRFALVSLAASFTALSPVEKALASPSWSRAALSYFSVFPASCARTPAALPTKSRVSEPTHRDYFSVEPTPLLKNSSPCSRRHSCRGRCSSVPNRGQARSDSGGLTGASRASRLATLSARAPGDSMGFPESLKGTLALRISIDERCGAGRSGAPRFNRPPVTLRSPLMRFARERQETNPGAPVSHWRGPWTRPSQHWSRERSSGQPRGWRSS